MYCNFNAFRFRLVHHVAIEVHHVAIEVHHVAIEITPRRYYFFGFLMGGSANCIGTQFIFTPGSPVLSSL